MPLQDNDIVVMMSMYPEFVYDEKRKFNWVCLVLKMLGLGFYSATTFMCMNDKRVAWFGMVSCGMLTSICNTIRYECAFCKINGTTFQSIEAFKAWKTQQKPHIKYMFDFVEFIIKVVYLSKSFPPIFSMHDNNDQFSMCELGGSVLNIHILTIMAGWVLFLLFLGCLYINILWNSTPRESQPRDADILNSAVNQMNAQLVASAPPEVAVLIDNETECCICLEKNDSPWTTSQCAHSFHATCISEWSKRNPSCPICRSTIIQMI